MKQIIFSTLMVKAILDGNKTQTRRVFNPQPTIGMVFDEISLCPIVADKSKASGERIAKGAYAIFVNRADDGYYGETFAYKSRYEVGDILYVREGMFKNQEDEYGYMADEPDWKLWEYTGIPSIHMPKDAARLFLKVTDLKVEWLHEILNHPFDMKKEGTTLDYPDSHYSMASGVNCLRNKFIELWDSINAKHGYPWESNPWVWVYEFERVEKPEGMERNGEKRIAD